jgi:hypothetical protein
MSIKIPDTTSSLKIELKKLMGATDYKSVIDGIKARSGGENLTFDIYKDLYLEQRRKEIAETTGTGLHRKKRIIRGRGYTKNEHKTVKPKRHYIGDTYYADMNKLAGNILCVKYASNDANLPKLKVQSITEKTKELIHDILSDKFDERIFKLLTPDDKRAVKRFVKAVKLDIDINDGDEKEFQRQFEICRGEYMSGNNSPALKATLKKYVLEALQEAKIGRNDAYALLFELSL